MVEWYHENRTAQRRGHIDKGASSNMCKHVTFNHGRWRAHNPFYIAPCRYRLKDTHSIYTLRKTARGSAQVVSLYACLSRRLAIAAKVARCVSYLGGYVDQTEVKGTFSNYESIGLLI